MSTSRSSTTPTSLASATSPARSTAPARPSPCGTPTPSAGRSRPIRSTRAFRSSSTIATAASSAFSSTTPGAPASTSAARVRDQYSFGAQDGPVDYYLMYGPDPKHVVETYAWLTGPTPLPPLWTLGFQQSRYSYYPRPRCRRSPTACAPTTSPPTPSTSTSTTRTTTGPSPSTPKGFPHFSQMIHDLAPEELPRRRHHRPAHRQAAQQGYAPYDTGTAGDHFVKNPDGKRLRRPRLARPLGLSRLHRRDHPRVVGHPLQGLRRRRRRRLLERHERAGGLRLPSKTMPRRHQHRIDEPGF